MIDNKLYELKILPTITSLRNVLFPVLSCSKKEYTILQFAVNLQLALYHIYSDNCFYCGFSM